MVCMQNILTDPMFTPWLARTKMFLSQDLDSALLELARSGEKLLGIQ